MSSGFVRILSLAGAAALFMAFFPAYAAQVQVEKPAVSKGTEVFNKRCGSCHGAGANGTASGPPLVHKIYHPNHHGDMAFHLAVTNGVRAHHWPFGDMPKVDGVSREDVEEIIRYIRKLQRDAGIF